MSNDNKRKRGLVEQCTQYSLFEKVYLPETCRMSVNRHVNTIYVGSTLRVFDRKYGEAGCLAKAHWLTSEGLFVTLIEQKVNQYVDLKYKQWVVDNDRVFPGALRLFRRVGSDDIKFDTSSKTVNEIKNFNSKILTNDVLFDFPTKRERETYDCCLFRLTCNCGNSKKVKEYTCSSTNNTNPGRKYLACQNKFVNENDSCDFFVWKNEINHNEYKVCKCGKLAKKITLKSRDNNLFFKYCCVNRNNKREHSCDMWE